MASATSWAWVPSCRSRSNAAQCGGRGVDGLAPGLLEAAHPAGCRVGTEECAGHEPVDRHDTAHHPGGGEEVDGAGEEDGDVADEPRPGHPEVAGVEEVVQGSEEWKVAPPTGVEQWVDQTDEGVPPETEGEVEREDRPGHLDDVVADAAPGHPVAHGRLEPAEEAGPAEKRLGLFDFLAEQGAAETALPAAEAPGTAQGQREEAQAEEGDGQGGAEKHGDADDDQAHGGEATREQVVAELGPGPSREGLAPDHAGDRTNLGQLLLGEGERHFLPPHSYTNSVVLGLLVHHASRLARSTPPTSTTATV